MLLRNPGGGFTAEAPIPVGAGALGLATADFNADGRPDLAVTSNTAGTVTALLRQAGGGFAADGAPLAAPGANGVAAGDFNGDGKPDLAASNDQDNTLSVFLNTTAPAPRRRRCPPGRPPRPSRASRSSCASSRARSSSSTRRQGAGREHDEVRPAHRRGQHPDRARIIDTTKGRIALTSAADTAGKKTADGRVLRRHLPGQAVRPKKKPKKAAALITDLVMKGRDRALAVRAAEGRAGRRRADKKKGPKAVLGKLWGNGKGKFRTNGKYSAATVRGTIWLVQDRCDGTLTKVRRGTVAVRDFKRKKTVTVKAGHSYLARAQRAASKAKRR